MDKNTPNNEFDNSILNEDFEDEGFLYEGFQESFAKIYSNQNYDPDIDCSIELLITKLAIWFDSKRVGIKHDLDYLLEMQFGADEIIMLHQEYEYDTYKETEPTWQIQTKKPNGSYEKTGEIIEDPLSTARNRHLSSDILDLIHAIISTVKKRKKLVKKLVKLTKSFDNYDVVLYLKSRKLID